MTYEMCLKLIPTRKITAKMLDTFYVAGRLTEEQYLELISLLQANL